MRAFKINLMWVLPVSSSTCKELGSCHSVPTISKQTEKSTCFCKRGKRTGQTIDPKIVETDRQVQGVMAYQSRDC